VEKYLTGNKKVLELGGNIGRNSVVISYILNKCNNNNLVTLETSKKYCDILALHRNLNNLNFHIENAALSKRKLIQKVWNTIPSDIILDGWDRVNTITFDELCEKYKIQFDTLVIDCEGAFFQILLDMPEMLTNIKTIIIENDYTELWQKQCVDHILHLNGFKNIDKTPLGLSIDWVVCPNNFYEVWRK
jgi:FkbM family methyltransferase